MKIVPNETDLIIKIESELKYDNLFNLIMERDQLKKELYHPDFISALEQDLHRWYSVAEAGRVIGGDKTIPPSSITYYIDNLKEYIIPEDAPSNKYIRLNYLSLIKIKMVFLLKDEFRLNGIRAEVGITGKPKNVSRSLTTETETDLEEMKLKLEKFEAMNEVLWGLLVEKGEDGQPSLKKPLKSLLTSETLLLEDKSSISQKLNEQNETIQKLIEENKNLKERINKTEQHTSSFEKKLEEKGVEREVIIESENKINTLAQTLRARQQAEEEWESQGLIKKLTGNKVDFINNRMKEILNKSN